MTELGAKYAADLAQALASAFSAGDLPEPVDSGDSGEVALSAALLASVPVVPVLLPAAHELLGRRRTARLYLAARTRAGGGAVVSCGTLTQELGALELTQYPAGKAPSIPPQIWWIAVHAVVEAGILAGQAGG